MEIDKFGCMGNTIKVSSGHYFDLANPDPESVDIKSIASALSKICRFGGHCPKFYSVAQHSMFCATLDQILNINLTDDERLAVLLHDATEAYVGDIVKPLKIMLPDYSEIEKRIEFAISQRFSVDFELHANTIKKLDRFALKCEKEFFWPNDLSVWSGFSDIDIPGLKIHIDPMDSCSSEKMFIECANYFGLK